MSFTLVPLIVDGTRVAHPVRMTGGPWIWLALGVAMAGGLAIGRTLASYLDPVTVARWLQ